jgi:hypothetical protein
VAVVDLLRAEDELLAHQVEELRQGRNTRRDEAALDARNRRLTRPCAGGELRLGQAVAPARGAKKLSRMQVRISYPMYGGAAGRFCRRRRLRQSAVIEPKSPCVSSAGPAVKNSVSVGPLFGAPWPNSSAQSPSMRRIPPPDRSVPRCSKWPFGSSA